MSSRRAIIILAVLLTVSASTAASPPRGSEVKLTPQVAVEHALVHGQQVVAARDAVKSLELALEKARAAYRATVSVSVTPFVRDGEWEWSSVEQTASGSLQSPSTTTMPKRNVGLDASVATDFGFSITGSYKAVWDSEGELSSSAGIGARLNLLPRPGRSSADLAIARAQAALDSGRADLAAKSVAIASNTISAYLALSVARQRIALAEASLSDARVSLARAERLRALGEISASGVMAAQITQEEAILALDQLNREFSSSMAEFMTSIGFPGCHPSPGWEVSDEHVVRLADRLASTLVGDAMSDFEALVMKAEAASPALQKRRSDLRYAEMALEGAKAGLMPEVYFYGQADSRDLSASKATWNVGFSAKYPLVDGGLRRVYVEDAAVVVKQAKDALDAEREVVRAAVRKAVDEVEAARLGVSIARLRLARAELDAAVREAQRQSGAVSEDATRSAFRALESAQLNLSESCVKLVTSILELARLTGAVASPKEVLELVGIGW
ncbi:MAG: TolC family protein [Firmicutes bacterium]|jgi:outer membrane protein TolC|nr:TolC family protein [Bacillota bacterium]